MLPSQNQRIVYLISFFFVALGVIVISKNYYDGMSLQEQLEYLILPGAGAVCGVFLALGSDLARRGIRIIASVSLCQAGILIAWLLFSAIKGAILGSLTLASAYWVTLGWLSLQLAVSISLVWFLSRPDVKQLCG